MNLDFLVTDLKLIKKIDKTLSNQGPEAAKRQFTACLNKAKKNADALGDLTSLALIELIWAYQECDVDAERAFRYCYMICDNEAIDNLPLKEAKKYCLRIYGDYGPLKVMGRM